MGIGNEGHKESTNESYVGPVDHRGTKWALVGHTQGPVEHIGAPCGNEAP